MFKIEPAGDCRFQMQLFHPCELRSRAYAFGSANALAHEEQPEEDCGGIKTICISRLLTIYFKFVICSL